MYRLLLGLVIVSTILFAGIKKDVDDFKEFDQIPSAELAKLMANEMARGMRLPMKIDDITELVALYSFDTTIFVKKQVDIKDPQIAKLWKEKKNQLINFMLKQDAQNVCYNPTWQYLIFKRNIIPEFDYVDFQNKPIFKYTIEIEDCQKL